ncbi:MAG: prepilin-type N-terminal cleavage/methylation domain-containing protein [Bryobacteraceae bacterium]|nr:prepilin-type N-terminal cleavage/methylation domain-containing protein [Bryobacteraceae bacterium]
MSSRRREAGVTLVEMIVVVAIVGLIAAIAFPSFTAGLDGVRLATATDSIVAFLNAGLNHAERRQQTVEFTVSIPENRVVMRSTQPGYVRTLAMEKGMTIVRVLPQLPGGIEESTRNFYVYPSGAIPAVGIEISNARGRHRIVSVDPITGVAQTQDPVAEQQK